MEGTDFDLAKLLRPVETDEFLRDYWEKQPLAVSRNDAEYYRGLFTLKDVDHVIAFSRPKFTDPGDFNPGGAGQRNFIQGLLPDDEASPASVYPDVTEVRLAFQRGKTLILGAMQSRWGPVAALCRQLEEHFGCPVHTNLYLTPPSAQGFDPHYDTHEVFVLQIEGTKHWRFYGQGRELPLPEERATYSPEQLGPVTQETTVRPGDLLYMPRGHIHEAFTSDSLSLHLTVGIKVYRRVDLLHRALEIVSGRDARFRASLPPGLLTGGTTPEAEAELFGELLRALAEDARADEAIDRVAADFLAKLPALPGDSFAAVDVNGIGPDTMLERVRGAICREVQLANGRVGLQFPGGSLEGPPKIGPALHFIARTRRFAVHELAGGLTSDGKLVLVRRLVRDRLLQVVNAPPLGRA
jgi:hypothetical protein